MINDLEKRHETEITKLCFMSSMIAILPQSKLPSLYRSFASTLTPTSLMRLQHYVSGNVFSITPHNVISFKYQPIYGYGTARRQLSVIRSYTMI